ncbi:putative myc-type, basic helix-loop-helix (bHLH) domain-containing protein [Plasmopara halstedii]
MDFDDDMSGLQIEDLGEYFLQTDINDSWKGFALGYTDEEYHQNLHEAAEFQFFEVIGSDATISAQNLMSPSLASISESLNVGNEVGIGLNNSFSYKDASNPSSIKPTSVSANSETIMINRLEQDTRQLKNFSLEGLQKVETVAVVSSTSPAQHGDSNKAVAKKAISPLCQNILAGTDDDMNSNGVISSSCRNIGLMDASCEPSGCSTIGSTSFIGISDDGRGFRKKSREKMRRQEVNTKFEELVVLLGLSSRVRKSAILQEALSNIKSLKRERDELRRDRDRLQLEVSKLATCLQYSHLESGPPVAMTQPDQQHMNASTQQYGQQHGHQVSAHVNSMRTVQTYPDDVPRNSDINCFPLTSAFSSISSQSRSLLSSKSGQVAIAPKLFNNSASDTAIR